MFKSYLTQLKFKVAKLLLLAFLSASATGLYAEPIWQGLKSHSDDFLIGTIHVGDDRLKMLSPKIKAVIDEVDVVVVEVDLSRVSLYTQQQETARLALLPKGQTLEQLISEEVANKVNQFLMQHGTHIEQFQQFKPWMMAIVMVQLSYQKLGLIAENGVDQQIIHYANYKHKEVIQLETFTQQLNMFNRLFDNNPDVSYDDMLNDTLIELRDMSEMPIVMLEAWLKADIATFEDIYSKTLKSTKYDSELEHILLVERNKKWKTILDPLLKKKSVAVATGTLHYIGPTGLPNLLDAQFKLIKN